jgi:hypothetical protein
MFSNVGTFRDFTLYVLPGNLSVYLFLKIFVYYNKIVPEAFQFLETENWGIILIFASFASLYGFFQSQMMINAFNGILKLRKFKPLLLENLGFNKKIQENLEQQIKTVFNLDNNFAYVHPLFNLCNAFVLNRTNEHSYSYARRLMSYSLFACVVPVPVLLAMFYLLLKITISVWSKWLIFIFFSFIVFFICYRIALSFRKQAVVQVYNLFLSLPPDQSKSSPHNEL